MNWILAPLALLVVVIAAAMAYVRLAPTDAAAWHVDPMEVDPPKEGGWLVRPARGNAAAPVFPVSTAGLLEAIDSIARETPRTERLAGSVQEGRITYVTRSQLWGFPDYITVAAIPTEGGAAPVIYSRLRFGKSDMGVNRKRAEDWVAQLRQRLG
ncbi:Protein of unknown function [Tranquillimonas rosea]|uniref:DUF1499 domain-containing protein n=1 Tax=Tranquillimonas rosea TaxID=641238 RepID=A0A1H9PKH4_9RHOB|nr:DUF1499 domain-containing protein [Tranquillimonas rosea]SER48627.1 Protein of unknown function [Tranquillimonas rosea]